MIKVIKTEEDHATSLATIERLMDLDPDPGTPEGDELEALSLLVQEYERREFPIGLPNPIDAIRFRMDQQNLTPRDLIPFIGSRSKVSEVLAGKRPLTLSMIRALHSGLGVPAKVLLQEQPAADLSSISIEWERFPLREMIARGWIHGETADVRRGAEGLMRAFLAPLGPAAAPAVLYRKTNHVRSARSMHHFALLAWTARVTMRAAECRLAAEYVRGTVSEEFLNNIVRLSLLSNGPALAQEFLGKHGIPLVIEPHLPRTHLDGAAIMGLGQRPFVALTLRHDRIDNFWFCLLHELSHVSLHLEREDTEFFDDLDSGDQEDPREKEADDLAGEALIPSEAWNESPAKRLPTPVAAEHLARKLSIHPAIVAGRIRHDANAYRMLNQLVGHGEVRKCFPGIQWD